MRRLLLVIIGLALVIGPVMPVLANPESGDITVQGTVQAAPPTDAPVFTQPNPNQTFTQSPITVAGTCTGNTTVEVYKNNVFAGSTPCQSGGTFSITIDLFIGTNTLIAKLRDSLDQYGPDSAPLTVFYNPPAPTPGGGGSNTPTQSVVNGNVAQLVLLIDSVFRGVFPGDSIVLQPQIVGGTSPYAIKIEWGDGEQSLIARQNSGIFNTAHIYKKPGTYIVTITASDKDGQKAFIQTVVIVNGKTEGGRSGDSGAGQIFSTGLWSRWYGRLIFGILFLLILLGSYFVGFRRAQHKFQTEKTTRPPY